MNDYYGNYIRRYEAKTGKSRRLYSRSEKLFPGGISHNIRYFEPYPFFVNAARGKSLSDVDGNRYTDYWMGHWALILGHSPAPVASALARQVKNGTLYGVVNDVSVELAEAIQKLMPRAEMMRFSSTGSEATMYAVRLARAKTGRRVIAKAIGGWHGFNTTLMQTVNFPFEAEEGPGLVQDEGQYVESVPFNDLEASLKVLETIKDDLACVIIEPVLGGAGCVPPAKGYLEGLQEFCKKNGALFILDEIVTGFRLSLHGAQGTYGLEPDLFTLGKICGGGMPIGVVCGDKDIMSLADPVSIREKEARCAIGGGTFSANPATMVAGLATLDFLRKNERKVYGKVDRLGEMARKGLAKIFADAGIPCRVTGINSIFLTHFVKEGTKDVENATDVATSDRGKLVKYHMALMAEHGVFFLPTKMGAMSYAHDEADVKKLLSATEKIASSGLLK
ncbi:aspartate aminotransferase family protein [Nitrososphaera viennensis]|uniref:Glutamate-1-semialdehyde 2,1-aminomutase n=2 Tax=Nitrososphaera viennensis TaxID=1034015 RepID=A0A060HG29_9ARCH|nr:aspartate aminotransferase family protein [Nitrososphaera viennensis]AIC14320.1 glutamate-1-semialdehyde 2,1-aminomutase [Nitrososphaera viennensis EN76]UVS69312.1 aspartate aminotransferase family protein [Nitrososphaera viennensis]